MTPQPRKIMRRSVKCDTCGAWVFTHLTHECFGLMGSEAAPGSTISGKVQRYRRREIVRWTVITAVVLAFGCLLAWLRWR